MQVQIVIPARLASTRLPEKLLLRAGGKSVLQHTYEAASRAACAEGVIVAVDDPRLAVEVDEFGGSALMTNPEHTSGTDRVAEVAATLPETAVFVNVQGDEPEIDPAAIDLVAGLLQKYPAAMMATVATPIRDPQRLEDPGCVKVVIGADHQALYFSRAAVPHVRGGVSALELDAEPPLFWHHLGLYAYRREFLQWFAAQPPGRLEQAEKLEQLRALEAGRGIVVGRVEAATPGIDTLDDFEAFRHRVEGE
ncbi:3-deoxy-manno-octulosonate cytidylyltransferase [Candidatus Laterigemmans baculatus]|uniref:3-deoxy-manno-octulosonate cytidylyltransferase n=1 Tax=Candidatus Laterigemmans baculatus TaxID=2770505 RepID=UPI00193B6450|nr:3-deoxy-manno-octulosonate cytidylyltransferase [Candidatus Laterigemmans baculatus]